LREQYLIGETDYLNVLSAITEEQRLQRAELSARLDLILYRISLYLALAGDFESRPQYPSGSPAPELVEDE
jgi:outer membrane protein TolC